MVGPSRHFFDLSAAAQLSRSLRRGRAAPGQDAPAVQVPPGRATPVVQATAASSGLGRFQGDAVQYAEELWQAILAWVRDGLGAQGVFALDMNGFSIGSVGERPSAPAEVLMASFTSVAQLLEAYLMDDRPLTRLVISTRDEGSVTMVPIPWDNDVILFGIFGGRPSAAEELHLIGTTVSNEYSQFGLREE